MSDNEYNDAAESKIFKVLSDDRIDVKTKTRLIGLCIDEGARPHVIGHINNSHSIVATTALNYASVNGYRKMVELLIEKGADVNQEDVEGYTALMLASREGYKKIVELLLENGADVNVKGYDMHDNVTALHYASKRGDEEIVKLLIEKGANVNSKDLDDYTALHIVSLNGHDEIVKLLIEKGADVNAKTDQDETALMYASEDGYKEIVKLLLENGADVNIETQLGTALHKAAKYGHKEIVELLIEKGADVNAKAYVDLDLNLDLNAPETPLEVAKNNGHEEIVEILENKMQELKAKEEMKKKIEAIKENKLKEEQEKENKFTKMIKGEMYRLDIEKLPEVSLCGEINVKLADYKKDLEALQSGEMLTFGRTKNEDETIEIDRGEKLVSFEDKSNHVSRKHLSVVNFGGNLYMQDRSLNGTGMREASKTDKAKTLIKPMEKER